MRKTNPAEHDSFTCPFCKADLSYEVNGNRYSKMAGLEIQGEYDGVSYWYCPECLTVWDRFTGEEQEDFFKEVK